MNLFAQASLFSMAEQSLGVGESVRLLRVRRGLTLRSLAKVVGVSVGTMSAIENGKVAVTIDRLRQLANALGVDAAALMDVRSEAPVVAADPSLASVGQRWREFGPLDLDPVLEAAVEAFSEVGYHGATMRMIADAADVGIAGIYRHHQGKKQLITAIGEALEVDAAWRVEAAAADFRDDPARAFGAMVEALSLCQIHRLEPALVIETELRRLDELSRERIVALRHAMTRRFEVVATAATELGQFGTSSPAGTARTVVALCRALPLRFGGGSALPGASVAEEYANLALLMMMASKVQQN